MINPRKLTRLHQNAMSLAHAADSASDPDARYDLARKAFEAEREAAELLFEVVGEEPSRSILYRSAAVLAFDCGEIREAERLATVGLTGNPPDDIARELREVLGRAKHQLEVAQELRQSLESTESKKSTPGGRFTSSWPAAMPEKKTSPPAHEALVFAFNGIDGTSGEPFYPPVSLAEMDALARTDRLGPQQTAEITYRPRSRGNTLLGVGGLRGGFDVRNLADSGWGVVLSQHADPEVREALTPLLEHRRRQATVFAEHRFRELDYQPGESKRRFLTRFGVAPSAAADPDRLPYYLLLVGSPEEIPWSFQHQLAVQYGVGRLFFDTAEEYASYAKTVVAAEMGRITRPRRLTLFGTRHDQITALMTDYLVSPLHKALSTYPVETILGGEATKERLARLLGGDETPALLFTASHGMVFPAGDPRQFGRQGALLCQDWTGGPGPIGPDAYLAGDDVAEAARPAGLVAFFYACHGAGTPQLDEYSQSDRSGIAGLAKVSGRLAPQSFVACLPRRLLGHPAGGALAVIGQVERPWVGYSLPWQGVRSQTQVFEDCLKRLLHGYPVGAALEPFTLQLGESATELTDLLGPRGYSVSPEELVPLWTAYNDSRAYALLGDPAVRLPMA